MLSKMILWFKARFSKKANRKTKGKLAFNADNPFLIL
jgi:hypothetical protein